MRRWRRPIIGAAVLGCLLCASARVSAEWFVDAYGGAGFTESGDIEFHGRARALDLGSVPVIAELEDVKADTFPVFGLRVGHWFEAAPDIGVAIDAFHFAPDVSRQRVMATANISGEVFDQFIDVKVGTRSRIPDFNVPRTAVTAFDLMLRRSFWKTQEIPHGQLQPYITVGPALVFTSADPDVELGLKVGGGLAWQFHPNIALFGEYRYTHFPVSDIDVGRVQIGDVVQTGRLKTTVDVNTHFLLAGISFRF